jgi:NAD(P)-dependent dehydrogenase (short-subunit alcohol dehydrogenase family)
MARFPAQPRSVITGAGGGFGRALAYDLARRQARLVLSDVDLDGLAETAGHARSLGAEVVDTRCDVRDAAQVEALAELAHERFGGVDILCNNAGIAVVGAVGEVPLDEWQLQLDINLYGVIYGCHSFVPRMRQQGSGFILNVASAAGLLTAARMGPYNVSKAGVIALSETLYGELHGSGVHVSALCPTFFRTNIGANTRSPDPRVAAASRKLVERAKWSAKDIAAIALRGLERGQLYIVPQSDGRLLWAVKRALPQTFHRLTGRVAKRMSGTAPRPG